MTSLDDSLVDTDGTGVSVSIGGAVYFALEGAGTGVYVSNTVGQTVEALIVDSDVTAGGQVAVHATDESRTACGRSRRYGFGFRRDYQWIDLRVGCNSGKQDGGR